jgi:hypothetical protein
MHVFSRLLSRLTGRDTRKSLERPPSREPAFAPSGPLPLAPRHDNPVVQAFLGGGSRENVVLEAPAAAASSTARASVLLGVLNEEEARRIHERWTQQGAYSVENTRKPRMTRRYFWWRQRVEALLWLPPSGVKDKVEEWRRWLTEHEAHALWKLHGEGQAPKDPGGIPSELAHQVSDGEALGEPPPAAFRFVLQYTVKLPDQSQYAFRDDPVQLEDKYLVQESGVTKAGPRICSRADVEELFTCAGISDATERKVMKKVSEVHGGFETINTCDSGFVSAGFVPFTAGESGEGSLAHLLRRMKAASPSEFEASFRNLGIDVSTQELLAVHPDSGTLLRGREAVSAIIEDKRLTAVFYNAGKKSRAYQVAQLKLARELYYLASHEFALKVLTRVDAKPGLITICGKYGDVLRSEAGKVAIMDRAVQQGVGNARQTFKEACLNVIEEKGLSSVEELALYEALITPVLQSPGKDRVRVLEDKELSRPAEPPLW